MPDRLPDSDIFAMAVDAAKAYVPNKKDYAAGEVVYNFAGGILTVVSYKDDKEMEDEVYVLIAPSRTQVFGWPIDAFRAVEGHYQQWLVEAQLREVSGQQAYETRRSELAVQFAQYGFYGTLVAALTGMVVVLALAIVVAWANVTGGINMVVAFSIALTVGVVAFGFFSLFKAPKIGVEWDKFKTTIDLADDASRIHSPPTSQITQNKTPS